MITILLEKIITILEGWIQSFTSHSQHVEDKLDSLDQTASDIETNTEPISDIADNTGAVITPIQNIKSNTDSIATSSQTSANKTTAILNNISTLSTNTGRAAAFAEDCANNTLEVKNKVTTIGSDTTQLRTNSDNMAVDLHDIKQSLQYYFLTNIVTEDSEGSICNFDTDLKDYLQNAVVTISADISGVSAVNVTKCGKNLFNKDNSNTILNAYISTKIVRADNMRTVFVKCKPNTKYTVSKNAGQRFTVGYTNELPQNNVEVFGISTNNTATNISITTSNNALYLVAFVYNATLDSGTAEDMLASIQIEEGNATTYEPYNGNTTSITFGTPITDGAEVDLLSGIVKINTSPITYVSITPIAIRIFKGINNVYSDIGDMSVTYRETLKHYLDKNNQ